MILEAGAQALASGGIADLDLATIAAQAGLKPSSLRYYFANKEALAEALYLDRIDDLCCNIAAAKSAESLIDAVAELIRVEVQNYENYLEGRATRQLQLGEVRSLERSRRRTVGKRVGELLQDTQDMLDSHGATGPSAMPLLPAQLLLENIFWMPAWIENFQTWEFEFVIRDLAKALCSGLVRRDHKLEWSVVEDAHPDIDDEDRDDAFLRTATQLICQRGYRGTSIDAIAAELGLTKGSFYHHNAEKESLAERCFEASYARVSQLQHTASEMTDAPLDRIAIVIASIIEIQMHKVSPIMRASAFPSLPQDLRMSVISRAAPLNRWYISQLAKTCSTGETGQVDPFIAAQVVSNGANASYDLVRLYGYEPTPANKRDILHTILHGIAK